MWSGEGWRRVEEGVQACMHARTPARTHTHTHARAHTHIHRHTHAHNHSLNITYSTMYIIITYYINLFYMCMKYIKFIDEETPRFSSTFNICIINDFIKKT